MSSTTIAPVLCPCGTLLPPVETKNPVTGEVRVIAPWPVKGCPVCQARAEREAAERAARKGQPKSRPRHDYFDDYFQR